jgi:hypothetical protein
MSEPRDTILRRVLLQNFSTAETERHLEYLLTNEEIEFIKLTATEVLINMPQTAFNCTQISAIWAAIIQDHSTIPVSVICGDLQFMDRKVFACNGPLPDPDLGNFENMIWDGHCWLEFGGLIADASFFRTIYFGDIPSQLRINVIEKFGEGRGSLIGDSQQMELFQLTYLPKYSLSNFQIDALINGIKR